MKHWECTIIGGGPGGAMAALTVARGGRETLVLERKRRAGWPVSCGEAVSEDALDLCDAPLCAEWIVREVKGAKIITPNGGEFLFPRRGFCIKRDLFDQWLLDRAEKAGAVVRLGVKVEEVARGNGCWRVKTGTGVFDSRILVMASGANSRIKGACQMRRPEVVIGACQFKFRKSPEITKDYLEFYHGERFHPGYGWIFDRGPEVSVGMGGYGDVLGSLKRFCVSKGFDLWQRISSHFGHIPVSYPETIFERNALLWVGDAAGLVHPLTRGGVHLALHSGKMAGGLIAEALDQGNLDFLKLYQESISRLVLSLRRPWRESEWFYSVPDRVWNMIGNLMDGRTYDAMPLRKLPNIICRDPFVSPWLLKFFSVQRSYKKAERFSW